MKSLIFNVLSLFLPISVVFDVVAGTPSAQSYDFIVVGGGVAGCTVASRLSQNGKHTVLLLEAGGFPIPELEIPAYNRTLVINSPFIKQYKSVPQANAALRSNGIVVYQAGWGLGGGSAVNGLAFNRGHPRDYSVWANRVGDASWTYKNMLKYYRKLEHYEGDFPSDQHGFHGPITVSRSQYTPGLETVYAAGRSLGYPITGPSSPEQISFTPREYTMKRGRRVSSYIGYIRPILQSRKNLAVVTHAFVTRVVFAGNQAIGVIYTTDGIGGLKQQHFVRADKEIILSAGPLESPALLMKSGVGPIDVLSRSGILPVKILPVGKNLQDHINVQVDFSIRDTAPVSQVMIPSRDLTPENFALYNRTGEGPYSSMNNLFNQAFLASSNAVMNGTGDWPDIQLELLMGPSRALNPEAAPPGKVAITGRVFLVRNRDIGRLTLNASHPGGDPVIDFNYLSHPEDMDAYVDGIKQTIQIYEETPAFRNLDATILRFPLPACDHLQYRSDGYWKCYIKQMAASGFHAVGTCSMGKGPSDPSAVVDPQFKVIGLDRLRVVDGSVIPYLPNANTQAPIYAIAEKSSEAILQSYEGPSFSVPYQHYGYGWRSK